MLKKTNYLSPETLLTARNIIVDSRLTDRDINFLSFLPNNAMIEIKKSKSELTDEEYLQNVLNILEKISKLKKTLIIKFSVEKRSILEQLAFDFSKYVDLSIIINNDDYDYPIGQFLEEEKVLDSLIKGIKESTLTPFEKYIAVYNIVKNFKPFKDNASNPSKSRSLRYILNNKYMVCVGYARLLEVLLDKVGIRATDLDVSIDTSYDKNNNTKRITNEVGHQRVLINIDDDKYGVHGIFVADPTWDNDPQKNYLNHALMPFEMMQVEKRLFWLRDEDLIFDVHDFNEFNKQINYYIERKERFYRDSGDWLFSKGEEELIMFIYDVLKRKIDDTLGKIDDNYIEIVKKYNFITEKDYENFLTEIGHYIIKRTNQKISGNVLIEANSKSLKQVSIPEITEFKTKTKKENAEIEFIDFPYQVPENDLNGLRLEENTTNRFH